MKQIGLKENIFDVSELLNFKMIIEALTVIIRYANKSGHNFKSAEHLARTSSC